MEDVLAVYARSYAATQPVVCLDETSRQLLGETREPRPVAPGVPARHDPEYVRGVPESLALLIIIFVEPDTTRCCLPRGIVQRHQQLIIDLTCGCAFPNFRWVRELFQLCNELSLILANREVVAGRQLLV